MRSSIILFVGSLLVSPWLNAAVTRDIDYLPGEDYADGDDRLDVHMPDHVKDGSVLVFFHGGALRFGDKSYGDVLAKRLLPLGIGVVSANYRLSPAVRHPAHAQDAASAFAWTVRHIADYGGDPARVYVSGHSAGAYLAALLALDRTYLGKHGLGLDAIRGAVLISPFLYVEETARDRPKTVWGMNPDDWLAASVTPHIGPGDIDFLLLYADGDEAWRKAQNERFVVELSKAGSRSIRALELDDRDHRSLMIRINEPDDRIGVLIRAFLAEEQ
jgi:acetyl esterase/lipase